MLLLCNDYQEILKKIKMEISNWDLSTNKSHLLSNLDFYFLFTFDIEHTIKSNEVSKDTFYLIDTYELSQGLRRCRNPFTGEIENFSSPKKQDTESSLVTWVFSGGTPVVVTYACHKELYKQILEFSGEQYWKP